MARKGYSSTTSRISCRKQETRSKRGSEGEARRQRRQRVPGAGRPTGWSPKGQGRGRMPAGMHTTFKGSLCTKQHQRTCRPRAPLPRPPQAPPRSTHLHLSLQVVLPHLPHPQRVALGRLPRQAAVGGGHHRRPGCRAAVLRAGERVSGGSGGPGRADGRAAGRTTLPRSRGPAALTRPGLYCRDRSELGALALGRSSSPALAG